MFQLHKRSHETNENFIQNSTKDATILCLHRDRKIKGHILHIGQLKVINVNILYSISDEIQIVVGK